MLIAVLALLVIASLPAFNAEAQDIPHEEIRTPTEVRDLVDLFARMKFSWSTTREGEMTEDVDLEYRYLGEESLEGETVDKISLDSWNHGQKNFESALLLEGTEIRQAELDGQIIPGEMVQMMGEGMLETVFLPFYEFDSIHLRDLEKYGEVSRSQVELENIELDLIGVEVQRPEEYNIEYIRVELAEFDDFYMLYSYELVELEDDVERNFIVTDIEER